MLSFSLSFAVWLGFCKMSFSGFTPEKKSRFSMSSRVFSCPAHEKITGSVPEKAMRIVLFFANRSSENVNVVRVFSPVPLAFLACFTCGFPASIRPPGIAPRHWRWWRSRRPCAVPAAYGERETARPVRTEVRTKPVRAHFSIGKPMQCARGVPLDPWPLRGLRPCHAANGVWPRW